MKAFWYFLVLLQIIMWILLFLFGYMNIADYNKYIFSFFMSSSSSVCFCLNYMYFGKKLYIERWKSLLILFTTWIISLFLILAVLLFGYIIITILFCWFLFTIIYLGKKIVF